MKKILFVFVVLISLSLSGCLRVMQLKKAYSTEPVSRVYDKPQSEVWQAIMTLIVEKNLPVNLVEKESGVVSSYQASYIGNTTYESSRNALPLHKSAYIITHRPAYNDNALTRFPSAKNTPSFPFDILTGRFKIQVIPLTTNKTEVKVILGGFEFVPFKLYDGARYYPEIYSLQVFENEILDGLSKKML